MLISFSKNVLDEIRPIFEGIPLAFCVRVAHLPTAFDTGCLAAIFCVGVKDYSNGIFIENATL